MFTIGGYTDTDGRTFPISDYPGKSYRAAVVNRALRRKEFLWVTVRKRTFPMFQCCHCENFITFAGVQGDHIVAQAHFGDDSLGNLQVLCSICNAADTHHRGPTVAHRTRGALKGKGDSRFYSNDDKEMTS